MWRLRKSRENAGRICDRVVHRVEGLRILAGCEKLWKLKRKEEEADQDEGYEGGCRDDIDDDTVRYRIGMYEDAEMNLDERDMQVVMECDECGPNMTEYLLSECEDCGTGWVREANTLTVIGNNVIALFLSLHSANTGRIVR